MKRLAALIVATCGVIVLAAPALADPGSITIDPFSQNITIQASQAGVTSSLKLINGSTVPRTFTVSTVDFGGLDETGGLVLLGENAASLQKKYGLTNWLSVSAPQLTIPAGQSGTVLTTVTNRIDLAPGGHYGAVIFTEIDPAGTNSQVGLHQAITSLLFVTKLGGEKYGLTLEKTNIDTDLFHIPQTVSLTLRNTGNVHAVPRGTIEVLAPGGKLVARGVLNLDSALVMPEQRRTYNMALEQVGRIVWPGRYTVRINYRYDGQDSFTTVTRQFYFANAPLGVAALFVALFVIAGASWMVASGRAKRLWRHILNK